MKNNEENIDKIIHDRFSDKDFGNPPQDFIDDLNKRLDERNRHGFFGPWNGILDVILIILLFAFPMIQFSNDYESENIAELNKQNSEYTPVKSSDMNMKLSDSSSNPKKDSLEGHYSKNENSQSNLEIKNKKSTLAKNSMSESANKSKPLNTANNNSNSKKKNSDVKVFPLDKKDLSNHNTEYTVNNISDSKSFDKTNGKPTENGKKGNNINDADATDDISQFNASHPFVYATEHRKIDLKIRTWDFPPIVSSNYSSASSNSAKQESRIVSPLSWELQLSSGLNFPSLNSSSNINGSSLLLNQQSGFAPSFTLGSRVSLWYNDLSITTGADVLSIKEENLFELEQVVSYDSTYVTSVDTTVVFDSVNQSFDTTYTYNYDSTTVTDTLINTIPVGQQYSWIQIPLQFGYKFQLNKWAIIPRVGVNLALGIRQQNKAYPNEAFDELQTYEPMTKLLMNFSGSLEVRRNINNWHIFARGDYQTGMRPILTGDYFERRYSGLRMNIGIGLTLD